MRGIEYKLLVINVILLLILAVFSYSYVDLNLTLTKNQFVLSVVSKLQYLGYYMRPQATALYLILISVLFSNFAVNLILFSKNKLSKRYLAFSTVISSLILIPSYPFLSSDLFNYLFDAKIITFYHANPYTHKPLDFPSDEWLRFMRWVHRYSPYGPLWLAYSVIPSLLSLGKFISAFFAFKIFIGVFHIFNSFLIYKTLEKLNKNLTLTGTAFYALNPIFLIEGIVNAHNDIVHAFFVLFSIYLLSQNKLFYSIVSIIIGSFVKYLAILSLAALSLVKFTNRKLEDYILLNLVIYTAFTFIFSTFRFTVPFVSSGSLQTQFQPWYLFWTLPLVALLANKKLLLLTSITLSFSALLRYIPFLYYGDWSHPGTIAFMQIATLSLPVLLLTVVRFKKIL